MTLTVNGINMIPYTKYQGFKWQRADVDSPDSGRTLDGKLHRGRVATKIRLDVECRLLTTEEASSVLSAISPEWVSVTYTDPMEGSNVTKTMYANNNPALFCQRHANGEELWSGITFPLVEQ